MMNCPNCGTPSIADQQFCRACGESLMPGETRRSISPQFWGLVMAFAGILIAMSGKLIDLRWLIFSGVFISIAGMWTVVAIPLLRRSRPKKARDTSYLQPESLPRADTTNKLSLPVGENDFVPSSVVEGTTELLKEPALRSEINRNLKV